MPQDYGRARTNLHEGRPGSPRGGAAGYGRKERGISRSHGGFFKFQLAVSLLCIAAAAALRLAGGEIYQSAREAVSGVMNAEVTSSQVSEAMAAIRNNLPDVKGVFSTAGASSGAPTTVSGTSSGAASAAAAQSAAKSQAGSAQGGSSSSAASQAAK